MPVVSIKLYPVDNKDRKENFHGAQLLYVGWDKHLLFYAPTVFCLPPDTRFRDVVETHLANAYGVHPEFSGIDWNQVCWLKSGQPWTPDMDKSIAENGLEHKDVLRFQTPGRDGLAGVGV
ncbi:phenol hydroxylase subunit P4 [Noviherbaspirillum sedimenti]|uniref:Phenol hydroxylase n=1 Tax=Noviherbaspirillum sedimenti TaxID=2320865 RepID=A0A3A3G6X2_9BURK|nr:phenol hydroxylase subunit P4 [Noviherbaspirillum sedimenti]RJG02489.1 phenol hydroxylase [Noviherbaspirillum sedimenti]